MAKVLLLDVETAPVLAYVWALFDQNVAINQIHTDWHLLSWSAKWLDKSKIYYQDQRHAKNLEDDKDLLSGIWSLLDEADVIVTQNGKRFDAKKLNARFIINGMQPPSSYRHIDTLELAKKKFAFTSNKLEYMADKLCGAKKSQHKKFPGFELWRACLAGNLSAWREMEKYNKQDIIVLEQLYKRLAPWGKPVNFNVYSDSTENKCSCGSSVFVKNGSFYTDRGKFQRYKCTKCGAETRGTDNLLSKEKRHSLRR